MVMKPASWISDAEGPSTDTNVYTDKYVSIALKPGGAGMPVSKKECSACPIDAMLSVIDGRWKGTILWRLSEGPMRTGELRRSIPEITPKELGNWLVQVMHAPALRACSSVISTNWS